MNTKQTLLRITAIALLSVSLFGCANAAKAQPSDDKVNELAFVLACHYAYSGLGPFGSQQVEQFAALRKMLGESDVEEAKVNARASIMLFPYIRIGVSGAGMREFKGVCDDATLFRTRDTHRMRLRYD